jgi:hypothetical protein
MEKFDYKKFLTENKLTKASILREGFEEPKTEEVKPKSSSKDELKAKIKEMIMAELSNNPEDFEKASREVEYGVNPNDEKFDLKDFFMDDEEEFDDDDIDPEHRQKDGSDIDREMYRRELEGMLNEEDYDRDRDARAMGYRNAEEADEDNWGLPKDNEENPEVSLNEEEEEEEEEEEIEITDEDEDFNIDTSAVDPNIKAVQDALTQAQAAAKNINDDKLTQQIGNTITMFTRTHIANTEKQVNEEMPMMPEEYVVAIEDTNTNTTEVMFTGPKNKALTAYNNIGARYWDNPEARVFIMAKSAFEQNN